MITYYATTFFKPFFFEAALSVNLTTMLVMTNIFISKMESLPPTSATKMIDYWLILCQLVPFVQVVLLTAMEFIREDQEENHVSEKVELAKDIQVDNTQLEVEEDEAKPKEASSIVPMKHSWTRFVPMLKVFGKSFRELLILDRFFQRRK